MQKVSFFSRLHPFGTQGKISRQKAGLIAIFMGMLVIFLSVLASRSSSDFGTLYERHARAQVATIDAVARDFGVLRQQQVEGNASLALQLPVIFSGALNFDFLSQIDGKDGAFSATNLGLNFESMVSSGSLTLDELKILSLAGDSFFLFKNLQDAGFMTPEMKKIFETYNNSWLAWTREDALKNLSGATAEEKLSFTVTENVSKMSLKDLERYLVDFPLLQEKESLGMSGEYYIWSVDLHRENIVALAETLARDLTQSGMLAESRESLKNSLDAMTLSGTVAFHPSNAEDTLFSLTLAQSGGEVLGTFEGESRKNHRSIALTSPNDDTRISVSFDRGETQTNVKLILSQSGTEVANINFVLTRESEAFKSMNFTLTAQGVTASLSHEMKEDNRFEGRLTLPVGAITWTGAMDGEVLGGLSLRGVIPDGALSMDLVKSGSLLAGPLSVTSLGEEVLRANVELEVRDGVFGFMFDIPTTDVVSGAKLNLRTTYDVSDFGGKISRPSPTRPLDGFIQALESAMPTEDFVEVSDDFEEITTP